MRDYIKYFLLAILSLWIIGFWYMFSNSSNKNDTTDIRSYEKENSVSSSELWKKIKQLEKEFSELELKNLNNEITIKNLKESARKYLTQKNQEIIPDVRSVQSIIDQNINKGPSNYYEETRRKIFSDIKDLKYFLDSELSAIKQDKNQADYIKSIVSNRVHILLAQFYNLSISDQLGEWRKTESKNLASKVQKKFYELQNPSSCKESKKIICDLNKACGFGCQMHHVMYCFITSFFMQRTMILESQQWRYNPEGYEAYFRPVSDNCSTSDEKSVNWNDHNSQSANAIRMPIIDIMSNRPQFLPLAVPKEYFDDIKKFHGDPFVWWAGQILNYLMRFNSKFEKVAQNTMERLQIRAPCVGVHVRRTDKVGTEAAFHGIDEYMKFVDEYFDIYELEHGVKVQRTVYLATDEVDVISDAKRQYKDYKFLYDESSAKSAGVNQRYTPESAQGVILDIYLLSQCDYLVCTFSSQVCRMAYELMQDRYPDASWRFKSLDDVYYYGGQNGHSVKAIYDHIPRREKGEIELKAGDTVGLAGNHWNGFSKGRNFRTNEEGLFPSYKVVDVLTSF